MGTKRAHPSSRGDAQGSNPFEQRWARRRHNSKSRTDAAAAATAANARLRLPKLASVGPSKGPASTPVSRAAVAVRLAATHRRNVFADRRIGEADPNLPEEDRYLARLQRERSKRAKKRTRFSLREEHDDHDPSFHDVPEPEPAPQEDPQFSLLRDDYDDAQDQLDSDTENPHDDAGRESDSAGSDDGFTLANKPTALDGDDMDDDDEARNNRSRQEIMNEVVTRSKMYKAQRQHDKAVDQEQTEQLDSNLPDIMNLLSKASADHLSAAKSKPSFQTDSLAASAALFSLEPSGKDRLPPLSLPKATANVVDNITSVEGQAGPVSSFHYETIYQQLASEKRAHATSRLLTAEELASAERERLLELEKKRRERMQNLGNDDTDDGEENEEGLRNGIASAQASSLRKNGVAHVGGDDLNDDSSDLDSSADENDDDGLDGKPANSDEEHGDSGVGSGDEDLDNSSTVMDDDQIPFAFSKCPAERSELERLFRHTAVAQRGLIVERLMKCFAVSLNPSLNGPKIRLLLDSVLERLDVLASRERPYIGAGCAEIDVLLPHVFSMASIYKDAVIQWARGHIEEAYNKLCVDSSAGLSSRWDAATVLSLRSISRLFPGSDMRHAIATPLSLLLSEALAVRRLSNFRDIALACFVCEILLEMMAATARFSGQVTAFLNDVLSASSGVGRSRLNISFKLAALRNGDQTFAVGPLQLRDCFGDKPSDDEARDLKIVRCVQGLAHAYLFRGRVRNVDVSYCAVHGVVSAANNTDEHLLELRDDFQRFVSSTQQDRVPLMLYSQKSRAIISKPLNPKFSAENGVFRKRVRTSYHAAASGDISASARRIRKALSKEERGMVRDLRRDALEIAQERNRLDDERDAEREVKTREVQSFLEQQQSTWNEHSKRQKKLSGKKW